MPIYPPGQNGLAGEIQALKQQVAELSRRQSTNTTTVCSVRLSADAGIPQNQWADMAGGWTVLSDPLGIWVPDANFSHITIPFAGRWNIHFHVAWADYCFGHRAARILKNGTDATVRANVIASDIRMASGAPSVTTEGTINCTHTDRVVFSAGDLVYFAVFQLNSASTSWNNYSGDGRQISIAGTTTSTPAKDSTYITARYLGPN